MSWAASKAVDRLTQASINYSGEPILKGQCTKTPLKRWLSENVLPFWDTKQPISHADRNAANLDTFFNMISFGLEMLRHLSTLVSNGQTFSSLTGRTSGLPKGSYLIRACGVRNPEDVLAKEEVLKQAEEVARKIMG
jgi:hypothetical protein